MLPVIAEEALPHPVHRVLTYYVEVITEWLCGPVWLSP